MSDLPDGWLETEIGQIADIVTGGTPSKSQPDYYGGDHPFFKPGDLDQGGLLTRAEDTLTDDGLGHAKPLPAGSLLVTCIGNLGKSGLTSTLSATNQQINAVLPSRAADRWYLYYWSRTIRSWLEDNSSATTVAIINKGRFSRAPINLPPLAEQRRIVEKLDALTARTARARADLDRIPALAARYKQAVLAKAFSGELTADWRGSSTASLMAGALPASWKSLELKSLASDEPRSIQSGPFGSNLRHSEFRDEGYLVIGIDNVQDGRFSSGSNHRISEPKFKELEKYRARPGDVAITVMATVGRTCVIPDNIEPAIITKHIYRITLDRAVADPYFVMNALRGAETVLEQMGANVRGQTRPGINGGILKSLKLPIPPIEEQEVIVHRINNAFADIDRMVTEAAAARRLLDRLDQAVLAKAFRGELVPQDPSDEPASVLLDRIRAERAAAPKAKRGRRKTAA